MTIKYPFEKLDELANKIQSILSDYNTRSRSIGYSGPFDEIVEKYNDNSAKFMSEAGKTILSEVQKVLGEIEGLLEYDDKTIRNRITAVLKKAKLEATHQVNPLGYAELASTLMNISGQLKVRPVYRPKVFVGHSFKTQDDEIVRKFLTLFTSEGFECETGERPEADNVNEKVKRRIIENEGVIIIFTKDEKISERNEWTAPPWLIDEKAFAIANGKPILLFFEDVIGQRQREGIQGNLEYIIFNRDDSSDAIIKAIPYLQDFKQRIQTPDGG
jgi:hypothetical protein